jgi:hypothetical protein
MFNDTKNNLKQDYEMCKKIFKVNFIQITNKNLNEINKTTSKQKIKLQTNVEHIEDNS